MELAFGLPPYTAAPASKGQCVGSCWLLLPELNGRFLAGDLLVVAAVLFAVCLIASF